MNGEEEKENHNHHVHRRVQMNQFGSKCSKLFLTNNIHVLNKIRSSTFK